MTITNWLSPEIMRPAGWALLHFVWQGTALAALAAVAISLIRRASARYLIAVTVLVMMLAAPAVTFFLYRTTDAATTSTIARDRALVPLELAKMAHASSAPHPQ